MTQNSFLYPEFGVRVFGHILPTALIQTAANQLTKYLSRSFPTLMEKLMTLAGKTVVFHVLDLPFDIFLSIEPKSLRMSVVPVVKRSLAPAITADVAISATSQTLLMLILGYIDGDTAFFSRDLSVSGDTETLLRLRNIIDAQNIALLPPIQSVQLKRLIIHLFTKVYRFDRWLGQYFKSSNTFRTQKLA